MSDGENEDAGQLLERARQVYLEGKLAYRDRLLEVGRLLHEFVVAHLKQGLGMHYQTARAKGFNRSTAIRLCYRELRVARKKAVGLIRTAMVVDLLGGGCDLGSVSYTTFLPFDCFVERHEPMKEGPEYGNGYCNAEDWFVRGEYADAARQLFARAVAEKWSHNRAKREVAPVYRRGAASQKPRAAMARRAGQLRSEKAAQRRAAAKAGDSDTTADRAGPAEKRRKDAPPDPIASARVASPGDVAEMCWRLITVSEDPPAVMRRLRVMIEKYKPPCPALV